MARPVKQGIDYFPLDCYLDDKFKLIEAEFGLKGFAVVVKLFQKIYGERGYYCEWTKEVALLFGMETSLGDSAVSEIVRASVNRGIFNKNMFDKYKILTSDGIQERYFEVASRRTQIFIDERYLLVTAPKNTVFTAKTGVFVYNNAKNVDDNPQRKEEERKVKESKVNSFTHPDAQAQETLYNQRKHFGGIGKDVVLLSDDQTEALLEKLSLDEFDKYVGIVAENELNGKHYTKKTHYQAILDMAMKDRRK